MDRQTGWDRDRTRLDRQAGRRFPFILGRGTVNFN